MAKEYRKPEEEKIMATAVRGIACLASGLQHAPATPLAPQAFLSLACDVANEYLVSNEYTCLLTTPQKLLNEKIMRNMKYGNEIGAFTAEFEGSFTFQGSWKSTYVCTSIPGQKPPNPPVRFEGVFSDLLYQPYFCASTPIRGEWLAESNIERRSKLSLADFREEYEEKNIPVIITDAVPNWPALSKWNRKYLMKAFSGSKTVVGDYSMNFSDFLTYCDRNTDDMPLYLFDKRFADAAPRLAKDYEVPVYFAEDLFSLLGDAKRPDYRWLIMGSPRSGSSFHKDPNATSAWNAVVRGSKKWILYPPHVTPPGVHASEDGADVATPISLIEWFLAFYEQMQEGSGRPREAVVRAGELLFVPRGWWHMALNLEESIAVTQNYVSAVNLPHVLSFLATESEELISGCCAEDRRTLHCRFLKALQASCPEVLEEAVQKKMQAGREKRKAEALSRLFQKQERASESGFRFGFA